MVNEGYEYDVFLSYRREDPVRSWVHNHFHPLLVTWLRESLPSGQKPRVFIDLQLETGSQWATEIEYALLRSRCLVCVWSPSYFGQEWCRAEWESMAAREKVVQKRTNPRTRLVCPIRFHDGDCFPEEARAVQQFDLSRFNIQYPQYQKSDEYTEFDRRMQAVAQKVAEMIREAPDWDSGWPLVPPRGPSPGSGPVPFSRL